MKLPYDGTIAVSCERLLLIQAFRTPNVRKNYPYLTKNYQYLS